MIFLVDDNPEFAYLIERYCETCGFQAYHFQSTGEVHGRIQQNPPAALVLNMMLSTGDASNLIQAIKSDQKSKPIPIIVFSSLQDEGSAQCEGVDYFLLKPIMFEDFVTALQTTRVLSLTEWKRTAI